MQESGNDYYRRKNKSRQDLSNHPRVKVKLDRLDQLATILCCIRGFNGWHSYTTDAETSKVIGYLEERGFVETNQHNQVRSVDGDYSTNNESDPPPER